MLSASVMQMEAFWHNVATYVINLCVVFHLMNLTQLIQLGAERHTQKGTCNLHNEFEETEVDHIGHNFAPKYCHLKLAGSTMKSWLYFIARVGSNELDV